MTDQLKVNLIKSAKDALKNPYPKNSKFIYSAAVLTDKDTIYSASNYVSDTFSLTLHAEQSALAHAAAHGEGNIVTIAITSNEVLEKGEFTPPCHMCKQLLWESQLRSGIPMLVILVNREETTEVNLKEMLPFPWPAKKNFI